MEVQRMMRHSVRTCRLNDSLNDAAQIMWEDVCGSVPVVDDQLKPVGFLTDRGHLHGGLHPRPSPVSGITRLKAAGSLS